MLHLQWSLRKTMAWVDAATSGIRAAPKGPAARIPLALKANCRRLVARSDGDVVESGRGQAGLAAAAHRQTNVDVLAHADRHAAAELYPSHAVRRCIAAEDASASCHLHPIRQVSGTRGELRRARSGAGAIVEVDLRTVISHERAHGTWGERVANHHSAGGRRAHADHPGDDRAVTRERLIDQVQAIGGIPGRGTCAADGEGTVVVAGAAGQTYRAEILVQPRRRQRL